MISKIIKVSDFRKNLSSCLLNATSEPIVIQGGKMNFVVVQLDEYNRLSGFEALYKEEDPEGKYKDFFVKEMKYILANKDDINTNIKSLKDIK